MVAYPELLLGGRGFQADGPPKHLVDRRRSPNLIQVLSGVKVDGEWKYGPVREKPP